MKVISIVGARPQFIKLAPLSKKLREIHQEIIIHTGQHFDQKMSDIFFHQMEIPKPEYNLEIFGGNHGEQTGRMLIEIEKVLLLEHPDKVIVFGDTNSTLAGALTASKLHIPIIHIEAGLRSFDMKMPEEQNRIIADHLAAYLACPTQTAIQNLAAEGITQNVYLTGDIMADSLQYFSAINTKKQPEISHLINKSDPYILLTLHRASNTDNKPLLTHILNAISTTNQPFIWPIHPRTKQRIAEFQLQIPPNIRVIDPIGYLDMIYLINHATKIVTDSGGLQKEAFMQKIPCITVRDTTEWVETLQNAWNILVMPNADTLDEAKFIKAIQNTTLPIATKSNPFGNGNAVTKILELI